MTLSPHLDDAALSCGATLARASRGGWQVVIVSVFAGTPDLPVPEGARRFHERCGLGDDAMAARLCEDRAATHVLKAAAVRLPFLDCIYRRQADGTAVYHQEQDIFDPPSGPEPDVVASVARALAAVVDRYRPAAVLYPLGVGGHTDHLAVQQAVAGPRWPPELPTFGYEEVPYVLFPRCSGWEERIPTGCQPAALAVADQDWQDKLEAIEHYRSQLPVLFQHPDRWREELNSYGRSLGHGGFAERYWHFGPSGLEDLAAWTGG